MGRQLQQLSEVASRQDKQLASVGRQLQQIDRRLDQIEAIAAQSNGTTPTP